MKNFFQPNEGKEKVITPEKIEEWIAEARERPESAIQIIQQISRRLSDLAQQNDVLRAENIALQTGAKVEEFQRRIAHLEYQLELVRRQLGGELPVSSQVYSSTPEKEEAASTSLLLYDTLGRVLRWQISPEALTQGGDRVNLQGELAPAGEPLRLLAVPSTEELLFLFTSGRIAALPVRDLPKMANLEPGQSILWEQSHIPHEPNTGERLACLAPLSYMALARYFVQVSRKGCLKKIRTSMGQSILANRYLGPGIRQPPDQPFEVLLSNEGDRLALVTREGFLQCLSTDDLPPSTEEGLHLESSDHLVNAFIPTAGLDFLIMTQVGKAIHWTEDRLEMARTFRTKGQALYSASRREQGVRVVGAGSVSEAHWAAGLHQSGLLSLYSANAILCSGAIPVEGELLAFTFFAPGVIKTSARRSSG